MLTPQIADEGQDQDQRSGRRLAKREPVHHLRRREPLVFLDRRLRHIRQHGIGATEGNQRGRVKNSAMSARARLGSGVRRAAHESEGEHQ